MTTENKKPALKEAPKPSTPKVWEAYKLDSSGNFIATGETVKEVPHV